MRNPEIDWYNYEGEIIAEDEMKDAIRKGIRSIRPSEFVKTVIAYGNIDDYFDPLYDYVMEAFEMDELIEMMRMDAIQIDVNESEDDF